ncbi:MAG: hypothetical protein ACRBBS_11365 [Thalassovita sp.]
MCLTTEAIALFLNLLDPEVISMEAGQITIHASERDAVWVQIEEKWCTQAPMLDRQARFD